MEEQYKNENEQWRENSSHDCENLEFKVTTIKFYPEDEEKMKTMNLEEKNAFMLKLKIAGRYITQ